MPEPTLSPDEEAALQQRIATEIRSVDPFIYEQASDLLRRLDEPHPAQAAVMGALAAAANDDLIWNALAQVRQVVIAQRDA